MKTSRALLLAALVASTAFSFETTAFAQSDADKQLARDLSKDAARALSEKKFEEARDKFSRAEALFHAPTLVLGIARAYVGLGKYVEAKEAYNRVVREDLGGGASSAFVQAKKDAEQEMARLDDKIGTCTVRVSAEGGPLPADLSATIDGETLKQAAFGLPRPANPGRHRLSVEAAGYASVKREFEVVAKKDVLVEVKLVRPAAATEPAETTAVNAPPTTPETGPDAPVETAPTTSPEGDRPKSGSTQRILALGALGLGGAGLVLGGVTGGLALSRHGSLADECPNGSCAGVPDAQAKIDSYEMMGTLSTVGFIAGGVFAATGVALLVTAPSASPSAAASPFVTLGLGPTSVRAKLSF